MELLSTWEELTPAERRIKSGGNHVYWHKKYVVTEAQGVRELLITESEGDPKVSSRDKL